MHGNTRVNRSCIPMVCCTVQFLRKRHLWLGWRWCIPIVCLSLSSFIDRACKRGRCLVFRPAKRTTTRLHVSPITPAHSLFPRVWGTSPGMWGQEETTTEIAVTVSRLMIFYLPTWMAKEGRASGAKKNAPFVEWSRVKCTRVFNGRKRVIAFSSRSPTTFQLCCVCLSVQTAFFAYQPNGG